jgi:hypothetical protein
MVEIKNLSNPTFDPPPSTPSVSPASPSPKKKKFTLPLVIFSAILLGFILSRLAPLPAESETKVSESGELITQKDVINPEDLQSGQDIQVGKSYGNTNQAFKDTAQGILEKNGLDTEGTHKLLRDDRPDQTVHLVSSVLDLDLFDGREVEIWGETFDSQKAGWLMDVGLVKVLK